jgi:gamma-glutamyltranspeptidase/glutathione hydrolase
MDFTPASHTAQNWHLTKPAASGRRGMVVSQSKNASEAGVAVLDAGGNAIDAAVATALALAAVEPWNSGLGGVGHAMVHRAGQTRAEAVDFGPTAPAALDAKRFKLTGRIAADLFAWPEVEDDANVHGPLSFVIPSAVAGLSEMHGRWGRLPLAEVAAPSVALAKRGLPQDWYTTLKVSVSAAVLRKYPESTRIYAMGSDWFTKRTIGSLVDERATRDGVREVLVFEGRRWIWLLPDLRLTELCAKAGKIATLVDA